MIFEPIDAMPSVNDFNSNVSIFRNTRAVEIADKLNAVAEAIKEHSNEEIVDKINTYINGELHPKLQGIVDTVETTVTQMLSDIESTTISNVSNYTSTVSGYTTDQTNSLLFTGDVLVEYDELGNISKQKTGNKTSEVLTVNSRGSILTAKETIEVDGSSHVKNYIFSYHDDGITVASVSIN